MGIVGDTNDTSAREQMPPTYHFGGPAISTLTPTSLPSPSTHTITTIPFPIPLPHPVWKPQSPCILLGHRRDLAPTSWGSRLGIAPTPSARSCPSPMEVAIYTCLAQTPPGSCPGIAGILPRHRRSFTPPPRGIAPRRCPGEVLWAAQRSRRRRRTRVCK